MGLKCYARKANFMNLLHFSLFAVISQFLLHIDCTKTVLTYNCENGCDLDLLVSVARSGNPVKIRTKCLRPFF